MLKLNTFLSPYYEKTKSHDVLNRMLYLDLKIWLPDDLLMKADKMTMATSMELRVPFLDHKLVEFTAVLPSDMKLLKGETKYLLKQIMTQYLPKSIVFREKKGFPVPIQRWFQNEAQNTLKKILLDSSSACITYFRRRCIETLLEQHRKGQFDNSDYIWTLIVFEYWHKMFIENKFSG